MQQERPGSPARTTALGQERPGSPAPKVWLSSHSPSFLVRLKNRGPVTVGCAAQLDFRVVVAAGANRGPTNVGCATKFDLRGVATACVGNGGGDVDALAFSTRALSVSGTCVYLQSSPFLHDPVMKKRHSPPAPERPGSPGPGDRPSRPPVGDLDPFGDGFTILDLSTSGRSTCSWEHNSSGLLHPPWLWK